MYNKHPKLVPDIFWDRREPILPYTKSSLGTKLHVHPHLGSTVNLAVEPEDFLPMETIMEEDNEDFNYSSPPTTSMVDYTNSQPNWFQDNHSVIQMDTHDHNHNKFQTKQQPGTTFGNVSLNPNEQTDNLRTESNQSSRCTSRTGGIRFVPDFVQDSKIFNVLFGGSNPNNSCQTPSLQYQNYSNLLRHHQQQHTQHPTNPNTFLLKTPTRKQRHHPLHQSVSVQHQPTHDSSGQQQHQQNDQQPMSSFKRSNPNQSSLRVNQTPFSMNASSNASIGGNMNSMNFTSLSASTMNSQHLSNSHHNLTSTGLSNISTSTANTVTKAKLQPARKPQLEKLDDLTSSNDDQSKYEQSASSRNHRNLRLNRTLNHSQMPTSARYSNLPTAPVLPTFGSSVSASKNRASPFMNRLRNSLNNFSSHHYRNLNKLSARNKQNSFSSAISLKSKCDNPTSDQMVTPNGFHFPQAYIPPTNPNQYLPPHLQKHNQENASVQTLDQENDLNNSMKVAPNLNRTLGDRTADTIEIKISPASQKASNRDLNSEISLSNLEEEENLIVMEDQTHKEKEDSKETEQQQPQQSAVDKLNTNYSNYTISTAAAILKASNESELVKLKSAKSNFINQDSVPMTSGTLTSGTLTGQQSKSSSTHSSSAELQHHEGNNENQSLINRSEAENSSSSNSNETTTTAQTSLHIGEQNEENGEEDEDEHAEKPYSPNEDCHEERYVGSPTSSNDSLSPYESNQNTVSSYTQLLEKDKRGD